MSKDRSGYVYQHPKTGACTARITFTDSHGKRQDIRRTAENKTDAKTLLIDLINKIEAKGEFAIVAEKITFRDLTPGKRPVGWLAYPTSISTIYAQRFERS